MHDIFVEHFSTLPKMNDESQSYQTSEGSSRIFDYSGKLIKNSNQFSG
jgi:hypothetical protein